MARAQKLAPPKLATRACANYLKLMNQIKSIPRRSDKKPKPPLKCAEVISSTRLTPNMQRIVLGGPDVAGFTPDRAGANLKICVPDTGIAPSQFREVLNDNSAPKRLRTFTVQSSDPVAGTLTVDFALHEPVGHAPAGDWARAAQPGDLLGYRGPSDKKLTRFEADTYILVADMTALPAIAAILADMPRDAVGHAFIEITQPEDAQNLDAPEGIEINWLVHPDPSQASRQAIDAVKALPVSQNCQVAVIGEHSVVATLKDYFFGELGLDPDANYISPYWKIGLVEEEHQALKKSERG